MKMTRCLEKYEKQQRPKQKKPEQQKQKKRRNKKKRTMEVKRMVEKWEIWDEEEVAAKCKEKAKKLVSQRFYKQIYVFGKKSSEKILTKKVCNHAIEMKNGFVSRKEKVHLLSEEEVYKFIEEQLRKEYLRLSKSSQMALVFFVGKKNCIVQNYRYLNKWTIRNDYSLSLISDIE